MLLLLLGCVSGMAGLAFSSHTPQRQENEFVAAHPLMIYGYRTPGCPVPDSGQPQELQVPDSSETLE